MFLTRPLQETSPSPKGEHHFVGVVTLQQCLLHASAREFVKRYRTMVTDAHLIPMLASACPGRFLLRHLLMVACVMCTLAGPYLYHLCTVYVPYMYCICTVYASYMYLLLLLLPQLWFAPRATPSFIASHYTIPCSFYLLHLRCAMCAYISNS